MGTQSVREHELARKRPRRTEADILAVRDVVALAGPRSGWSTHRSRRSRRLLRIVAPAVNHQLTRRSSVALAVAGPFHLLETGFAVPWADASVAERVTSSLERRSCLNASLHQLPGTAARPGGPPHRR
ncbi:hypothetical protein [Saccharopolyspora sp. 5N708]|uniref:hypothetical protein n=1 Tax=Saccharopolyspora sp. 5N708 TaxID=3457424 RepID=UPI003FD0EC30